MFKPTPRIWAQPDLALPPLRIHYQGRIIDARLRLGGLTVRKEGRQLSGDCVVGHALLGLAPSFHFVSNQASLAVRGPGFAQAVNTDGRYSVLRASVDGNAGVGAADVVLAAKTDWRRSSGAAYCC